MLGSKICSGRVAVVFLVLITLVVLTSSIASAQEPPPRVEVFAGYSWLDPGGNVAAPGVTGPFTSATPTVKLKSIGSGFGGSVDFNFNKWIGFQVDGGNHWSDPSHVTTVMVGPKLSLRSEHFSPFAEVLGGWARLSAANGGRDNGFGGAAGGGIDLYFSRRFALRIIQVDYLFQSHRVKEIGGDGTFNGARVQGGLVLGFGSLKPPVQPAATCSVQPTAVLAGEPIMATVTPQNFNAKHALAYDWKSTGGTVAPSNTTARIDTTGLNPGSYTVTATVTDPKARQDYRTATCNANFTINEPPKQPSPAAPIPRLYAQVILPPSRARATAPTTGR
jgi:hypothetical protein